MKKKVTFTPNNLSGLNRDVVSDESNVLFNELKNLSPNKKIGGLSIWKKLQTSSDYEITQKPEDETRFFKYNSKDFADCILQFYNDTNGRVDVITKHSGVATFSLEDTIEDFDELFCVQVDTRLIVIDNAANKSYLLRHDNDESFLEITVGLVPEEDVENPPLIDMNITEHEQPNWGSCSHERLSSLDFLLWQTQDETTENGDYTDPDWQFRIEDQSRYIVVIKDYDSQTLYQPQIFTRVNPRRKEDRGSGHYTWWRRPFYLELLIGSVYEFPDKYEITVYYSTSNTALTLGDDNIYFKIKPEDGRWDIEYYFMEMNIQIPAYQVEVKPTENKIQFRYYSYTNSNNIYAIFQTPFTYLLGRHSAWNSVRNNPNFKIKINEVSLTPISIRTYYSTEWSNYTYYNYWHEVEFEENLDTYGFDLNDYLTINFKSPGEIIYPYPVSYQKIKIAISPYMFGNGNTFQEDYAYLFNDEENTFIPDLYSLATGQFPEAVGNYVYLLNPNFGDETYKNMIVKSSDKLAGELYYYLFDKSFTLPLSRAIQNYYLMRYKFGKLFVFSDKLVYSININDDGTLYRDDEVLINIEDRKHIVETREGFYIYSRGELHFLDYNFNIQTLYGINNLFRDNDGDVVLSFSENNQALIITISDKNYIYLENFRFFLEGTDSNLSTSLVLDKNLYLFKSNDANLYVFEEVDEDTIKISFDDTVLQTNEERYYISEVIFKLNTTDGVSPFTVYYNDEHDEPLHLNRVDTTDNIMKYTLKMTNRRLTHSSTLFIEGLLNKNVYIKSIDVVINIHKGFIDESN